MGAGESAGEGSTAGRGLRHEGGLRGKCALPSSHPSLLHYSLSAALRTK